MLRLVLTCGACPEQYDVYLGDEEIGYLRLRHGRFRAEYHDKVVYTSTPRGDGTFADDGERAVELTKACQAILTAHGKSLQEICFTIDRRQYDLDHPPTDGV